MPDRCGAIDCDHVESPRLSLGPDLTPEEEAAARRGLAKIAERDRG